MCTTEQQSMYQCTCIKSNTSCISTRVCTHELHIISYTHCHIITTILLQIIPQYYYTNYYSLLRSFPHYHHAYFNTITPHITPHITTLITPHVTTLFTTHITTSLLYLGDLSAPSASKLADISLVAEA